MRRALLIGLVLLAFPATPARASFTDDVLGHIAPAYWDKQACDGATPRVDLFWGAQGEYAWTTDCFQHGIRLNRLYFNRPTPFGCRVLIHEYGHLLGQEHSDDPFHIMHADGPSNVAVAACRRFSRKKGRKGRLLARYRQPPRAVRNGH